jgi:hypothetical protein
MHAFHSPTLSAGLAAGCTRCEQIAATSEATSPGFDDRPDWQRLGFSSWADWAQEHGTPCEHCDGSGHLHEDGDVYHDDCPHCDGQGFADEYPGDDDAPTPEPAPAPRGDCYGYCKDCGDPLYPTGERGRRREWCVKCRPVQVQQGRRMPWEVDRAAVKRASTELGVTHPVYVKRSPGKNVKGRYHGLVKGSELHRLCEPDTLYHYVTIAAKASADDASRTLWHELTHAAQAERDAQFHRKYARIARMTGANGSGSDSAHAAYLSIPYEIEARKNSGMHDTHGALIASVDRDQHVDSGVNGADVIAKAQAEWDAWAADALAALEAEEI